MPSEVLSNKSPFEILMNKPPKYDHFRVFGCQGYVSTLPKTISNFSPRANPTVFHGYPVGYKGYKMLDISTNSVIISRDVVFHEQVFPYKDKLFNLCSSSVNEEFFSDRIWPSCSTIPVQQSTVTCSFNRTHKSTILSYWLSLLCSFQ